MLCNIIILYFYIYSVIRAYNGLEHQTLMINEKIYEYFSISCDTVLAWIKKRKMPATKTGRLWKFQQRSERLDEIWRWSR